MLDSDQSSDLHSDLHSDFTQYGRQSSAYFIFQEGVRCFNSQHGDVFYAEQNTPLGRVNIIFTNPLCAKGKMLLLLQDFLAQHKKPSLFVSVNIEVADALRQLGYYINQTGVESSFKLDQFDLHGHAKKQLRHASNFGKRRFG